MWHAKLWWNDDGNEQNIEIDNNCPNKLNYKVELRWNLNIFFSSRLLNCEMQLENSKLVVGCCTWNRYTTWWLQWKCHFSTNSKENRLTLTPRPPPSTMFLFPHNKHFQTFRRHFSQFKCIWKTQPFHR